MENPKLIKFDKNEWEFEYPALTYELDMKFYDASELMDVGEYKKAETLLRSIIKAYPNHIDAIHHLALIMKRGRGYAEGFELTKKAVELGRSAFPKSFVIGKDLLPWSILENRPFLRACHGLGLFYMEDGKFDKAFSIFNEILAMNPNDNQGIRALAIQCSFALKMPEGVLKICDKYSDDSMPDTLYGRALALFQVGKKEEAKAALKDAVKLRPKVAIELVKTKHTKPKNMMEKYVTSGGEDEAYEYWEMCGEYWGKTPGAIEFVREHIKHVEK